MTKLTILQLKSRSNGFCGLGSGRQRSRLKADPFGIANLIIVAIGDG
ncbi:MAG: hypothetical protein QNJ65_07405 [Xenococcaceae cyanobacterium MO_234.B1]|nr:hypothetical protein [Xenococcaceae cyanobacterium MO_234.B1]